MSEFYDYNFLCHHGIKGMKWGVRRYQNLDGSLTAAGKERYTQNSNKLKWYDKKSGILETRKNMLAEEKNGALWIPNRGSQGGWGPAEYVAGLEPDKNIKRQAELLEKVKKGLEDKYRSKVESLVTDIENYYDAVEKASNDSAVLVAGAKLANALDDLNFMVKQSYIAFPTEYSNLEKDFDPGEYVANFAKNAFKSDSVARKRISYMNGQFVDTLGTAGVTGKAKQRMKMPTKERPMTYGPSAVKHSINFNEQNYLCHYGIKGMKWGIRRYQNPDGSLTAEGIQRYGSKMGLAKRIQGENKKAAKLERDWLVKKYATNVAFKGAAKAESKLRKAENKNKTNKISEKEQRLMTHYAEKTISAHKLQQEAKTAKVKAEEHYNSLVNEFGKENVTKLSDAAVHRGDTIVASALAGGLEGVAISAFIMGFDNEKNYYVGVRSDAKRLAKRSSNDVKGTVKVQFDDFSNRPYAGVEVRDKKKQPERTQRR